MSQNNAGMKRGFEILLIIFFLGGHTTTAQTSKAVTLASDSIRPRLSFLNSDNKVDLGNVMVNSTVTCQVEFRNTGKEPLVISSVALASSPGAVKYKVTFVWPHKPVKAGKKGKIKVKVATQDEAGFFRYDIVVFSNDTMWQSGIHISGVITGEQIQNGSSVRPEKGEFVIFKHRLWHYRKK